MVSSAFGIFLSSSATLTAVAEGDLEKYWSTGYQLLVRPAGSKIPEEEELIQPNALTTIPGGITFEQWEQIKNLPEVEVAAPVSIIGYVPVFTDSLYFYSTSGEPVLIRFTDTERVLNYLWPVENKWVYYGLDFLTEVPQSSVTEGLQNLTILSMHDEDDRAYKGKEVRVSLVLAAIDYEEENALNGFEKAMVAGEFPTESGIKPEFPRNYT